MHQRTNAATRAVVAVATSVALSFGLGGVVFAGHADAATPYVAIGAVNVRSGPATTYPVLGTLAQGASISGSPTASGWVQVTFKGATGYVSGTYLKATPTTTTPTPSPTTPTPSPTTTGAAATKVTTSDLNLRSAPSLDASIVKVVAKGTTVATTGLVSGTFAQVTIDGATNWLSTKYLADPPSSTAPAVAYKATTTAALAMRKTPDIDATSAGTLPSGSTVSLTGTHSVSYSQIVHDGTTVWVLSGYLKTVPGAGVPTFPKSAGKRYVAVDEVNVRATSASTGTVLGGVTQGTVLLATGKTTSTRTQVIYNGGVAWAYSAYLSKTKPSAASAPVTDTGSLGSASLDRTNAYAKAIVREIRVKFPQIKTMYGWRMSSSYSSDHPGGRAIDIMIPSYKTAAGKALGSAIARYLQDNYKRLHVHYLIWRQRQWNVERNTNPTTGWRAMSDRGGDTANHMDHVHVSVYSP